MPLKPGRSRAVVSENIREMTAAGHPQRVAVAAALHNAEKGADMAHPHKSHEGKHPMEHDAGREQREGHKNDGHEKSIFGGLKTSADHGRDRMEKEPSPGRDRMEKAPAGRKSKSGDPHGD